ncbi:MAG: hypothetical protein IBX55_00610 [Methyloprofundus sp.]|nr:hypothetical protein [Methyloprofundus sp.]
MKLSENFKSKMKNASFVHSVITIMVIISALILASVFFIGQIIDPYLGQAFAMKDHTNVTLIMFMVLTGFLGLNFQMLGLMGASNGAYLIPVVPVVLFLLYVVYRVAISL